MTEPFVITCRDCGKQIPFSEFELYRDFPSCMCSGNCRSDEWYYQLECNHCHVRYKYDYQGKWYSRHPDGYWVEIKVD